MNTPLKVFTAGINEKIAWEYDEGQGLRITAHSQTIDGMATVIKITVSQ